MGEQSQVTLDLLHHFECPVFIVNVVDLGPRLFIVQVIPRRSDPDFNIIAMDVHTCTHFIGLCDTEGSRGGRSLFIPFIPVN